MTDPFDNATYYDCCDSEELQWESPEEALIDYFKYHQEPGADTAALVAEHAPVVVTAYARVPVNWGWLAENAADHVIDNWLDEYAGPDGQNDISDGVRIALERSFEATIARVMRDELPWPCDSVATREYSATEVEAILRRECPEWFE